MKYLSKLNSNNLEQIQVKNHFPNTLGFRLSQFFLFNSKVAKFIAVIATIIILAIAIYVTIRVVSALPTLSNSEVSATLTLGEVSVFFASTILIVGLVGEWFDSDRWKKSTLYTIAKLFVIFGVAVELVANIVIFRASDVLYKASDKIANDARTEAATAFNNARETYERVRWRQIGREQQSKLVRLLTLSSGGEIEIGWPANDPEAFFFAFQIKQAFDAANSNPARNRLWTIRLQPRQFSSGVMFGLRIFGPQSDLLASLQSAFNLSELPYTTQEIPRVLNDAPGLFMDVPPPTTPVIFVGSKAPPL